MIVITSYSIHYTKLYESLSTAPIAGATTSRIWVTISPFISTLSGKETYLIAGYMSGARAGATLTIAGKGSNDSEFTELATITPDENGLFIWPVPTENEGLALFRITSYNVCYTKLLRLLPGWRRDLPAG